MTYARDLAEAGVRVLLYQGAYLSRQDRVCRFEHLLHGSANMDIRSFSINYETNLVVYDEAVTRELEGIFHRGHAQLHRVFDSCIRQSACSNPPGRFDDAIVFATSVETSRCAVKSLTTDDICPSGRHQLLTIQASPPSAPYGNVNANRGDAPPIFARAPVYRESFQPTAARRRTDGVRMDGVR